MSGAPSAWDDDWESIADRQLNPPSQVSSAPQTTTKAERKARHAEANKQIWEAAERPERSYFLETKSDPPVNTDFKPQVKVLSRKPAPKIASRGNTTEGMSNLRLEDDEDSEEEARRKDAESLAERQRKAAQEREEKQRKYAEARQRLFGPTSSSTTTSQPASTSSRSPAGRDSRQGSRRGPNGAKSSHASSAEQSPARTAAQSKQLFDPNAAAKPRSTEVRDITRIATPKEDQPIRMPRGPDGSGSNGFGFAARGGRAGG